jgi:hypothetical protein
MLGVIARNADFTHLVWFATAWAHGIEAEIF